MTTLQNLNAQMADAIKQTEYDLARYEAALKTAEAELQQAQAKIADLEYRNEQLRKWLPDPDWENAPPSANWFAVDSSGQCFWYDEKPRYIRDSWILRGEDCIAPFPFVAYAPHSLTKRPMKEAGINE